MKSKTVILSIVWLLSLSAAYILGAKITSEENTEASNDKERHSTRSSYRSKATSSSAKNSPNARSSVGSTSSKTLNISDIVRETDPIARVNNLLALISSLGPDDFEQVVADFRSSGLTRERLSEYSILLHAWAKEDPLAALDYAEENTDSRFARQTILASWAGYNPDGALQWAESKYDGDSANPWLIGVIQGLVATNPSKASEIMNGMPYSRERGDALETIIPYIIKQGTEESIAWLDTIQDERLQAGATARIASSLSRQDPESTAAWVTSLDSGEARNRAVGEVADNWADNDVAAAVAWTESLSGEDKEHAARELIGEFTRENAEQASQWLDNFSGTDSYDRIAGSFIWSSARSNPELALAKVSTIQDTGNHARYYERILSNWNRNDAEAAAAWMQDNNISEEIRQRALRGNNDRRRGR